MRLVKTIALSTLALAAISGVSLANDRTEVRNAAWRNVHCGAVYLNCKPGDDRYQSAGMEGYYAVEGFEAEGFDAYDRGSIEDSSNFALRKLRGENFDNDN